MNTNKLKYKLYIFIVLILLTAVPGLHAQMSMRDSAINMHLVGVQYSMYWPGGDMADRFGKVNSFGITYGYKLKNNFYFEFSYGYIWGNEVKETDILSNIKDTNGLVIDNQGLLTPVYMELRGHEFFLGVGKIFPVIGPNPNSGLFLSLHGGLLQHKVAFSYLSEVLPQLVGDYPKGYDRLCNGFALKENIGYINLSNNNYMNWTLGFEFIQAFTESRREWNIDMQQQDTKRRLDLLFGFNLQIRLPFYKKAPDEFYYK
jgi:hypothetical protein